MKKSVYIIALCLLWLGFSSTTCTNPPYSAESFRSPGMSYRPIPLWFWNNTAIDSTTLKTELEQMITHDKYGGCAILPFGKGFSPEYLSEDYFALYRKAIEVAEAQGAHLSLYDEYGFPSGSMGAINGSGIPTFMMNHPGHTVKRLDKHEYAATTGTTFSQQLPAEGKLMSVVAWDKRSNNIISLRDNMTEGKLEWEVPEGDWTVMAFLCVTDGDPNVDYLSPESVKLFIEDTHETYFRHFPEAFGTTIVSTFFDEPTMYRAEGRMWTDNFNEQFAERHGFSPELFYPALWYEIGPQTAAARNLLFGMRATLYAEGFMKTISDWAAEHHILATGHQDNEEVANPTSTSGDLMLVGKHLSMPGIDKIGGDRPAENFYKVISSSAQNWDKTLVMSETFGDMGNISTDKLYQVAIEQYTKGINHLIPHAVWYDDSNVTFLPELSWRNDLYNKELPAFNTFLSRLNYILAREGRHVADVAMLYPIETQQAGHYLDGELGYYRGGVEVPHTDYPTISRLLTDELGVDFTYLHPEVLNDRCTVDNGKLRMNNAVNWEEFHTIILPSVKTISLRSMQLIKQAWEEGVAVIFTTQVPCETADFEGSDDEIKQIVEQMLNAPQNAAIFVQNPTVESLYKALNKSNKPFDVAFFAGNHPFNYLHKVIGGHDLYYFGNIDSTTTKNIIVLQGKHQSYSWLDPHTGDITPANLTTSGKTSTLTLQLTPNQSVFLMSNKLLSK